MSDLYAVFGNPIAHSQSPRIHTLFAQQTGQMMEYRALLAPLDGFAEAIRRFIAEGGCGMNVTVPFKQQAWQLADVRSKRAQRAGAVNTLMLGKTGELYGDNTDGVGLVRDLLQNHGGRIRDQRVLILGAGGAVRGVLEPILAERPAQLVIANRTLAKAEQLARDFADLGTIEACGFDALAGRQFDLLINGTAASLQGELPPLPDKLLADGAWCYDMMYAKEPTVFNRWAATQGAAHTLDGLGMLVEQAAEAFFLWRQVRPDTAPVIEALRADM